MQDAVNEFFFGKADRNRASISARKMPSELWETNMR